jgi:hypothetical protein
MQQSGLISVKNLLEGGFYHKNLINMARCCREETDLNKLISSYVLCGIFGDLADKMEAEPEESTKQKLEAKYKPAFNSLLENLISKSSLADQSKIIAELIQLHWVSDSQNRHLK